MYRKRGKQAPLDGSYADGLIYREAGPGLRKEQP